MGVTRPDALAELQVSNGLCIVPVLEFHPGGAEMIPCLDMRADSVRADSYQNHKKKHTPQSWAANQSADHRHRPGWDCCSGFKLIGGRIRGKHRHAFVWQKG